MTLLFIWTVVAATVDYARYDWRYSGEFSSPAACQRAAGELGLDPKKFRCVSK